MAKNTDILFWILGAVLLVGGGAAVYTMTRGLRNNNPGNIEYSSDPSQQWEGLASPPNDGPFAVFVSVPYGIRAMAHTLNSYGNEGFNTIASIITKWAPPSENDTPRYIAAVSAALQVAPGVQLDLTDLGTMSALVGAIITHENGLNPYSDATIQSGIALA